MFVELSYTVEYGLYIKVKVDFLQLVMQKEPVP